MTTLEELRRRNALLKAKEQNRREIENIGRERKSLISENRKLENPKRTKFLSGLGKGFGSVGRGLIAGSKVVGKGALALDRKIVEQGKKNLDREKKLKKRKTTKKKKPTRRKTTKRRIKR